MFVFNDYKIMSVFNAYKMLFVINGYKILFVFNDYKMMSVFNCYKTLHIYFTEEKKNSTDLTLIKNKLHLLFRLGTCLTSDAQTQKETHN